MKNKADIGLGTKGKAMKKLGKVIRVLLMIIVTAVFYLCLCGTIALFVVLHHTPQSEQEPLWLLHLICFAVFLFSVVLWGLACGLTAAQRGWREVTGMDRVDLVLASVFLSPFMIVDAWFDFRKTGLFFPPPVRTG